MLWVLKHFRDNKTVNIFCLRSLESHKWNRDSEALHSYDIITVIKTYPC